MFKLISKTMLGGLLVLLATTQPTLAQLPGSTGPTPGGSGSGPGTTPAAVPLDAGASVLLASGLAYGLRRLRAARRR